MKIKEDLYKIIKKTDDSSLLESIYDILKSKSNQKEGEIWKSLSEDQKKEVIKAEVEIKSPTKQVSHRAMQKKNRKWLGK